MQSRNMDCEKIAQIRSKKYNAGKIFSDTAL